MEWTNDFHSSLLFFSRLGPILGQRSLTQESTLKNRPCHRLLQACQPRTDSAIKSQKNAPLNLEIRVFLITGGRSAVSQKNIKPLLD